MVVQTVMAQTTTTTSTTSRSFQNTNLTANITPSSTSSKILIFVAQFMSVSSTTEDVTDGGIRLMRDSTVILNAQDHGAIDGSGTFGSRDFKLNAESGAANLNLQTTQTLVFLDSPSSTSALTYKTMYRSMRAGTTVTCQTSDTVNQRPSVIILQEVAG
tara:strand:+ start:142 stop:618 length:477 start_codon:yes stop_codon:yes gene_type:complete